MDPIEFIYGTFWPLDGLLVVEKKFDRRWIRMWESAFKGVPVLKYILTASKGQNWNFTHPIFESDFDCLTGKYRILALSLLPLLPLKIRIKILIKNGHFWPFGASISIPWTAVNNPKLTPLNRKRPHIGRFSPKPYEYISQVFPLAFG